MTSWWSDEDTPHVPRSGAARAVPWQPTPAPRRTPIRLRDLARRLAAWWVADDARRTRDWWV